MDRIHSIAYPAGFHKSAPFHLGILTPEMKSSPTHQHYVPQFILRPFASRGRSKQIYVFDKAEEKSFKTSIRNVASVSGFYDFQINGVLQSLDPVLQKLEDAARGIILEILQARSLRSIGADERAFLSVFVAVQMLRTDSQRRCSKDLNDKIRDAIVQRGGDPHRVEGFQVLTEEESRVEAIRTLPRFARELAPLFLSKSWILYSTPSDSAFYISDNPVTMHNTVNRNPLRGTLGLAVPGIEIYFPLSGTLCLGFLCPTLEAMIREGESRATRLRAPISFQQWTRALDGDDTLRLPPTSVTHHNSLQVLNAERYVFSSNGDFALTHEMLQSNPELKGGPRYSIG